VIGWWIRGKVKRNADANRRPIIRKRSASASAARDQERESSTPQAMRNACEHHSPNPASGLRTGSVHGVTDSRFRLAGHLFKSAKLRSGGDAALDRCAAPVCRSGEAGIKPALGRNWTATQERACAMATFRNLLTIQTSGGLLVTARRSGDGTDVFRSEGFGPPR